MNGRSASRTSSFAPFRHRSFVLVWVGALVSNVGTWMEATALGYYVAERGSASASGLVAAAGFLPGAFLGPVGGALADRFDRRRIMMMANAVAGLIAAAVAVVVAADRATPGNLALFSLAAGCAGAIGFPAFQAALPDLVPPEDLVAAIGLSGMQWNLGRILGPSAAAVAIAIGGVPTALWVNAVSFLAVIAALTLATVPHRPATTPRSVARSIADGVRFARERPAVRSMVPIMVIVVLVGAPFIGLIPQMATNVLDGDQTATSLLVTAQGVGAVAAGALIGSLSSRYGLRRFLVASVALLAPSLVVYGTAPNLAVAAFGLMCTGACYMAAIASFTSITQRSAAPEERGRAMVVNNFALGAAYPLGLVIESAIADRTSLRVVTAGSGLVLAAFALALVVRRPATAAIATLDHPVGAQQV